MGQLGPQAVGWMALPLMGLGGLIWGGARKGEELQADRDGTGFLYIHIYTLVDGVFIKPSAPPAHSSSVRDDAG